VGKGGNKGERWEVKRGDSFQGFTVKEVGMEGLRLTADGKEFLLPLYAGAPTAAGSAVRTDTTRRDAAKPAAAPAPAPASAPGSAVPAAGNVSGAPPNQAPASWPPFPTRSRRPVTAWPGGTGGSPISTPIAPPERR
jgi:hypothetical protein